MPWQSQGVFRGKVQLVYDAIAATQRHLYAPVAMGEQSAGLLAGANKTCIEAELTCCHTVMELWPRRHIGCGTPSKRHLQEPSTAVRSLQCVYPHLNPKEITRGVQVLVGPGCPPADTHVAAP